MILATLLVTGLTNMNQEKRSSTIRDVAKTAGVSVSTVSRVLNGKVDVAKETKSHVLKVIDDLGYSTNLAARSMRSQNCTCHAAASSGTRPSPWQTLFRSLMP